VRPLLVVVILACVACSDASAPASVSGDPGVSDSGWQLAPLERDPYAAYAVGRVPCEIDALTPEEGGIDVSTEDCNYATLVQETLRAIPRGSVLVGEISWLSLASVEPATATLALRLGEREAWTRDVPVPASAQVISLSIDVGVSQPAGAPIWFHVRNHGYNSWHLGRLTLQPRSQ
jgi:hypothetical protein